MRDDGACQGAVVRIHEAFLLAFLRDMPTMLRSGMKISPEGGVGTMKSLPSVTRDAAFVFFFSTSVKCFRYTLVSWIPLWHLFDRDRNGNIRLTLLGMRLQGRGTWPR